ncbi:response regulator transcription factor [uncultured Thiothrix sp.]|uniref:response regulator transcription factor n=1 Tax=uncultured Thiothrix sp. TaxID=223185 RepID=UPI0026219B6D|nr:response regulator transcription factor [uncultured Thiothrix sp.]
MNQILITDDHPIFVEGLESILRKAHPNLKLYHAEHIEPAKQQLRCNPSILLMLLDRTLPGVDSLAHLQEFLAINPNLRIAIISAHESQQQVSEAIEAGAAGFIPKSSPVDCTVKAIDLLLKGNIYIPKHLLGSAYKQYRKKEDLTARQIEILSLAALGQPNKKIALNLNLTEGTIKQHFNAILRTLHADNRTHAIQLARLRGFIA